MSADDGETLFTLRVPKSVAQTLFRFATNPVAFVGSIISAYIINAVLNVGAFGVNTILAMFGVVAGTFDVIRVTLINVFGTLGVDLLGAYSAVQQAVTGVIASAGWAAPILAVGFTAVLVYLGWELLKRLPSIAWKLYMLIPGT
ncbi:hypothetical protein [Haloarcula sp. JP-L23]|uniref:hypothetical protein n=1 Tax=Haloarcula sp. JP-L23 TaxID=2716717 RepID=UPI00140EE3FD|nr:hypothetical protein G9465_12315 [Haloarcula sp. JP-L23]